MQCFQNMDTKADDIKNLKHNYSLKSAILFCRKIYRKNDKFKTSYPNQSLIWLKKNTTTLRSIVVPSNLKG